MVDWLTDNLFLAVVRDCWFQGVGWQEASIIFQEKGIQWNKFFFFKRIHRQKRKIWSQFDGNDKSLSKGPNLAMENLQKELWGIMRKFFFKRRLLDIRNEEVNG